MRIAIMLRAYDRPGGIGIYCQNIVKHLLRIDGNNEYILIFNKNSHIGTYSDFPNVRECYVPAANPVIWDQLLVPRVLRQESVDLVLNTKFSVPLLSSAKKIMVLHGAAWAYHPEWWGKFDVLYTKLMMPVYCRAADFLISNSDLTTKDHIRLMKVVPGKIRTVRLAQGESFVPVDDEDVLNAVHARYGLPEQFILTVTSYEPKRKNFETVIRSFSELYSQHPQVHLVVAGKNCERYANDFDLNQFGITKSCHFPGWVDQADLPALYSLASAYLFPSVYEEFGIPVVEAMACGCPVVASDTGAIPELTGGAALLAPPMDYQRMAQHLDSLLSNAEIAADFRRRGIARARDFSWEKAAVETLEILERVGATGNEKQM